jgi:hypothetical protein
MLPVSAFLSRPLLQRGWITHYLTSITSMGLQELALLTAAAWFSEVDVGETFGPITVSQLPAGVGFSVGWSASVPACIAGGQYLPLRKLLNFALSCLH